jgi:O-antigen/teichoic acid export membrane protein
MTAQDDQTTEQSASGPSGGRQLVAGGSILMVAMLVTNAGNYLLNLLLGRWLSPAEFSDANLMVTLMLTFTSMSLCLELICSRFIGVRDAAGRQDDAARLAHSLRRWALAGGLAIGVVLAVGSPLWSSLFHTGSAWPFVILAFGMPFYLQCAVGRGVMQGRLRFGPLAITFLVEMVVRLSLGTGLVLLGFGVNGATAALALSLVAAWAAAVVLGRNRVNRPLVGPADLTGVRAYAIFVSVLLVGQIVINNGDVLISKIFLQPYEAGLYSAVALVGRAVFFLSWSVATVVFPVVAQRHAKGQAGHHVLAGGLLAVIGLGTACSLGALLIGGRVLGVVLGPEYGDLSAQLAVYAAATTLFAMANLIASHHLATGRIRESWVILAGAALQTALLLGWHDSMHELIAVQLIAMSLLLLAVGTSHLLPPAKPGATGAATGPANLVQQSVRPAKVER